MYTNRNKSKYLYYEYGSGCHENIRTDLALEARTVAGGRKGKTA